jgi:two-component system OmpR family response regulator
MEKILIIEDDADIRGGVRILLESQGYIVDEACNGIKAMQMFNESYHLLIIDIMMPQISGIQICKKIREVSYVPILFLTARSEETDKLEGLSAGGDDYLVKPFSYIELIARVKALLRRFCIYNNREICQEEIDDKVKKWITYGDLKVDQKRNNVIIDEHIICLTDTEYKILKLFIKYPTKIYSVENIYESVWEEPYIYSSSNTVMVHIKNLRNKLSQNGYDYAKIKTVWGKGYCFERQV